MAFDLSSIKKGADHTAPITVIHGSPGIGKTTFAANAPSPVFIRAEDGLGTLDAATFPEVETIDDVMEALASLFDEGHEFQSVVIDSLSALEPIIWKKVANDHGVNSIEELGFGKGYVYAMDYWRDLVAACKGLSKRGVTPLLLAHSEIVKFDAPDTDAWDRYQIKLHKRAFQHLYEQADIIGFAHEPVYVKKESTKDSKGKAKTAGGRQIRLVESPAVIAKNRYSMPETAPLDWAEFAQHVPFYNK